MKRKGKLSVATAFRLGTPIDRAVKRGARTAKRRFLDLQAQATRSLGRRRANGRRRSSAAR
jgi:hypothetical protein